MHVAITGGSGFIGTHLATALSEMECIDRIYLYDNVAPKQLNSEKLEFHLVDIRDFKALSACFSDTIETIYHLAAQTSGLISVEKPELDVATNVLGTLNITRVAKAHNVSKVIFTSSMATYGDADIKMTEELVCRPKSNYGVTKLCAENYIKLMNRNCPHIKYTIFRLFNVFGPGQDYANMKQGMVSIFLTQAILSGEVKVTGSLDRFRDLIYISDVISALLHGLDEKTDNGTYNVGSELKTTVRTLLEEINKMSKFGIKYLDIGGFVEDSFGAWADTQKLRSLGWKAQTTFSGGLLETYADAEMVLMK